MYTIVHHNDLDGCMAAAIVKLYETDPNVNLIQYDYKKNLVLPKQEKVYVVDCALKQDELDYICDIAQSNVWFYDHHISSHSLEGEAFIYTHPSHCATKIVYDMLYKNKSEKLDKIISLVQAYDCDGDAANIHTDAYKFNLLFEIEHGGVEWCEKILQTEAMRLVNDEVILLLENMYKKLKWNNIHGEIAIINTTLNPNPILSFLPDYIKIAFVYYIESSLQESLTQSVHYESKQYACYTDRSLQEQTVKVSIRVRNGCDKYNAHEIAKVFGGGGHQYAAGFRYINSQNWILQLMDIL